MGEMTDRWIQAIRQLLADTAVHVQEERIIRYIIGEIEKGRSFEQILGDPYVANRLNAQKRDSLVERPELIQAMEREIAEEREVLS